MGVGRGDDRGVLVLESLGAAALFSPPESCGYNVSTGMAKDDLIRLRVATDEKVAISAAAEARGLSLSAFVRVVVLEAASSGPLIGGGSVERKSTGGLAESNPSSAAASPRAPGPEGKCWAPWCEKKGPVEEPCPDHPNERFR